MKLSVLMFLVSAAMLTSAVGCGDSSKPTLIGGELTDAQIQEFEAKQKRMEDETASGGE